MKPPIEAFLPGIEMIPLLPLLSNFNVYVCGFRARSPGGNISQRDGPRMERRATDQGREDAVLIVHCLPWTLTVIAASGSDKKRHCLLHCDRRVVVTITSLSPSLSKDVAWLRQLGKRRNSFQIAGNFSTAYFNEPVPSKDDTKKRERHPKS